MRLTKSHREAFVRAALDDVPRIDYDEQIDNLVQEYLESICPDNVLKAYKNQKTKGYFRATHITVYRYHRRYFYLVPHEDYELPNEIREKINAIYEEKGKQAETRNSLERKLEGAISAFSTRKAAAEAMPEFEKYLPTEADKTSNNLPAVANLVADLIAAGWPKAKAEKEAKKKAAKK